MSRHPFYPSPELPTQIVSYAQGLADHQADYGDVPMNAPKDLAGVVEFAKQLSPLAKEIHDLELELAAKNERYHLAAAPLWTQFSERVGHAKLYAEKNGKDALLNFLRSFQHHTSRHAAAKEAGVQK